MTPSSSPPILSKSAMNTTTLLLFPPIPVTSPPSSSTIQLKPRCPVRIPGGAYAYLPRRRHTRTGGVSPPSCTAGDGGRDGPLPPPEDAGIRFRRGASRRRKLQKQQQQREESTAAAPLTPPPRKAWEEMSLAEKALELYVGEKGLLFWLNKLAYASIFIIIGAWIVFRFVGPALNLYQLDSQPLAPTSLFKG